MQSSLSFDELHQILLSKVVQRKTDLLYFDFYYKPNHPISEDIKEWLIGHDVSLFVAEQNPVGSVEVAGADFQGRPDLAALFKLRYC